MTEVKINEVMCSEIKLSNGDKVYIRKEFKGSDKIAVSTIMSEYESGSMLKLLASVPALFMLFCSDIKKGDKSLPITEDYITELGLEDYTKIEELVSQRGGEVINFTSTPKKKES